jgi:predicted RNA-binding protein with RPS1 domain
MTQADEFGRARRSEDDEAYYKEKLLAKRKHRDHASDGDRRDGDSRSREEPRRIRHPSKERMNHTHVDPHHRPPPPPAPPLEVGSVVQGRVARIESYGAFIELKHQNSKRGLLHVSQLGTDDFVERVEDVVQPGQELFVYILEIAPDDRGGERIRLSLKGVNQENGTYDPEAVAAMASERRSGDGPPRSSGGRQHALPHHVERRAEDRRRLLSQSAVSTWRDTKRTNIRMLWSASPEPAKTAAPSLTKTKDNPKRSREETPSDNESSATPSEESRRRRNKRRNRGRRSRRSKYTSSDESSDGTSSSSSSGSSSSRSESPSPHGNSKSKRNPPETITAAPDENSLVDQDELREAQEFKAAVQGKRDSDSDDDDDVGPQPLPLSNAALAGGAVPVANYGKALLPGEGQALAQYVQQNQRIPRRGEIGYSSTEIESYEHSGYVMSGSRHARMNAVRIRKENQVYSAEEKRALALITMEEKQQKEAGLVEDFRTMLKEKEKRRDEKEEKTKKVS